MYYNQFGHFETLMLTKSETVFTDTIAAIEYQVKALNLLNVFIYQRIGHVQIVDRMRKWQNKQYIV